MPDSTKRGTTEKRDESMNAVASVAAAPYGPVVPSHRELVFDALSNPKYSWRTVEGMARETGLSADQVERVLKSESSVVLRATLPDAHGRLLYTTIDHYRAHAGILRRVLSALSDQVR
jgi:hypothetical protein